MKRSFAFVSLLLIFVSLSFAVAVTPTTPSNFRSCLSPWKETTSEEVSREGLDTLRVSASAQPSFSDLLGIREYVTGLGVIVSDIYIVDLREEEHSLTYSKATITERFAVESLGMNYVYFPVTDHNFPSADVLEDFLSFYKSLPETAWVHFHCKAGKGRATSFSLMADIIKNSNLAYRTLATRQYLLGSTNLLDENSDKESKIERTELLKKFYDYISSGETESWKSYIGE
ncbi:MAG: hypothetical protein K6F82_04965 [Sphaerochaetaceae bacterium]|nr:hypothetical protein [Sphaerochaetaceae bacterium]